MLIYLHESACIRRLVIVVPSLCIHHENEQIISQRIRIHVHTITHSVISSSPFSRSLSISVGPDPVHRKYTYKKYLILQMSPSCHASPARWWPDRPAPCCDGGASARSSTWISSRSRPTRPVRTNRVWMYFMRGDWIIFDLKQAKSNYPPLKRP